MDGGSLRFWDLQHLNSPTKVLDPTRFGFSNLQVNSLQFSKHAPHILLTLCNDGKLIVCWDTKTEQVVATLGEGAVSPSGA